MLDMVAARDKNYAAIHILCGYIVEVLIVEKVDRSYSEI
jgi:hypothetical protein